MRIPPHEPLELFGLRRTWAQLAFAPDNRLTRQAVFHQYDVAVRQPGTIDAHLQRGKRALTRRQVFPGRLGQVNRKLIAENLLGGRRR